ncbi:MAG: hypothetical protein NT007_07980 [Candidatus Kapabacteria bacterium]|nr:hypothetical protein [Candidatus Kapabacteria bacterium]
MDNFQILIEFISDLIKKSEPEAIIPVGGTDLQLSFKEINSIKSEISTFNQNNSNLLKYTIENGNKVNIKISNNSQRIFYQKEHFYSCFNIEDLKFNFCVFDNFNNHYIYLHQTEEIYKNNDLLESNNFIRNSITYKLLLDYLRDASKEDSFSIFDDLIHNKIISIIPSRGKFEIGYSQFIPDLPDNINLAEYLSIITMKFEKSEFIPFFKNEFYDSLKSFPVYERFFNFILNIENILNNSNNNYEIYLSNFSVKNLLNEIRAEQTKYFTSIREILNKIYTYSISVPISISATLIGMLNINDQHPFILLILTLSFIIFAIVSIYYQYYLFKDIKNLEKDLSDDRINIINKSSLTKEQIEKGINNISDKLDSTKFLIKLIISAIVLFTLLIICTFFYLLKCCLFNNLLLLIFTIIIKLLNN